MKKEVLSINSQEFQTKVLEEGGSALVFFGAPYCAGCKALAPSMTKLAEEHDGKVDVFKFDVEENGSDIPSQLGVRGLPTVIAFCEGEEVNRVMGMVPPKMLKELAESSVKK